MPTPDDAVLGRIRAASNAKLRGWHSALSATGHCVVSRWIAERNPNFITETDQVINLDTASGLATCGEQLHFVWKQLGEIGRALVLPNTPAVLSVGRRCIDLGWHFEWPPFSHAPFMIKPDGEIIWLVVKGYVPELPDITDRHASYLWNESEPAMAAIRRRI